MGSYAKTEAGRIEIGQRRHGLVPSMRSLLLLVDGQRDITLLRHFAASLHAPDDAIEQLEALGLIASSDATGALQPAGAAQAFPSEPPAPLSDAALRYLALSRLMSEGVRAHLGLRGFLMQLRIERCTDAEALLTLLPDVGAAIARARTAEFADEWERTVRAASAA